MKTSGLPKREDMPPGNQQIFDYLKSANEILSDLYARFAYSDFDSNRYLAFQNGQTSLSAKEKNAVNLILSEVNSCTPCLNEHTLSEKMNGFSDVEISNIRNGNSSDIKLDMMIALAKEIIENKGHVSNDAIYDFFDAGYTKGNLVDLMLLLSDETASNRQWLTGVEI